MKLTAPTLRLEFTKDDITEGHSPVQIIGKEGIVSRSVSVSRQLFSALRSASNTVSISIPGNLPCVQDIISTEGNIKARLSDGAKAVFTGFLSTSFSWTVTDYGVRALSLTIEDYGTRLLEKPFIERGSHLFNSSAIDAIREIAKKAGIVLSSDFPSIVQPVVRVADAGVSAKELLSDLMYELGYVYYFTPEGELGAYRIAGDATEPIPLLDHRKLHSVGGAAITLEKNLRQYGSARVTYTALGTAENYLVYRNTTGKGEGHPYCFLPLKPGECFDGSEIFPIATDEEIVLPSLEAVNASGETDIVGSNRIIALSNLKAEAETDTGSITAEVWEAGGPYLRVYAENNGYLSGNILRLDAYADIIYEKSVNAIRAGAGNDEDGNAGRLLEEELKWIHSKTAATEHANLVAQYHRNAGAVYTFQSDADTDVGDIVRISDTVHSGLMATVLVFAKTETDESAVARFRAVAIEPFRLTDRVFLETLIKKQNALKGEDGRDGESYSVFIHSDNGSVFRMENASARLSCQVLKNNEDVTEKLEEWRFSWHRITNDKDADMRWDTSSKAIGHRQITIAPEDCAGRTVFTCTVDL